MTHSSACHFPAATTLHGSTAVPGDKSISHRSLMLASQALGTCRIVGLLEGEDVLHTLEAMRSLGVEIRQDGRDWLVTGNGLGSLAEPSDVLNLGNAGTGVRLLMGLLAAYPFTTVFTGDDSLRGRPMGRALEPLQQMGLRVQSRSGMRLPCTILGGNLMPIEYTLPVPSAQVKSAVLLAGLNMPGTTQVIETTASRDHTETMLQFFGFDCRVEKDGDRRVVTLTGQQQGKKADRTLTVPGDPSSAAFPLVAALITPGSEITITNICMNPLRTGLFTTLMEMGADLTIHNHRHSGGEEVADITARSSQLKGVDVPASRAPSMIDEYPILAMVAAVATGTTAMRGLGELRVKESNRLAKVAGGLEACGAKVQLEEDDLIVTGQPRLPGGVVIDSALDHRIAMSFLILGLRTAEPVAVTGTDTIATSFPGFFKVMKKLGLNVQKAAATFTREQLDALPPLLIAIDGPAASGKGTLARRLADLLKLTYLDTGSLYRAVGMKLAYSEHDPNDEALALQAARSIRLNDLTNPRLRQEHIGQAASIVSAIPSVRAALLDFQREIAASDQGAVLDGRDIGTVVCPNAPVKFFITADLPTRAKRRHRELQGQGIAVRFESVLADLKERDARDQLRDTAPMKPAEDAVVIDTSELEAEDVFEQVMLVILERFTPATQSRAAAL